MTDKIYCYPPDYTVLKNKLNLRNAPELALFETEVVMQRVSQGAPSGQFDLLHLKAIHFHLFQDIYDWAGELRTVELSKGGSQFLPRRLVESGMADIHRRLSGKRFLRNLGGASFADGAGIILGDINHAHPFREGNGRTQLIYLEQLALQAGHLLDPRRIRRESWIAASQESHLGRYAGMSRCIAAAISLGDDREHDDLQYGRSMWTASGIGSGTGSSTHLRGRKVGLILCGGIDPRILASVILRELEREQRPIMKTMRLNGI